ncbi:rod shape-determining protein MreC [Gottfriedia solisilvae]|uniref:Cell shape-determining protein MreC n=1 Tax=Gottfriedia solisilvae TaxID=1516104 RepID=A0A8J3EVD6_9BACI|nr:rod shape-determining protein MreC [Gottfriedia solisilvae]GGI12965.1 hypothetical protein GCM10007380_15550 [Gottfriedia solisilvae]
MKKYFFILILILIIATGGYYLYKNQIVQAHTKNISDLFKMKEENDYLSKKMDNMTYLEAKSDMLKNDNKELREISERIKNLNNKYETISAIVLKREWDSWSNYIEINKGSKDGVKVNTNVITTQGMIGKVTKVNEYTSKVNLISNQNYSTYISTMSKKNKKITGLIKEYDQKTRLLLMTLNKKDTNLKHGDIIITSGLGGVYLPELEIGKVKDIKTESSGLTQIAYIEPLADLNNINYVILLN